MFMHESMQTCHAELMLVMYVIYCRIIKPVDGSPVFKTEEEKAEYKKMWDNLQTLFKITGFKELVSKLLVFSFNVIFIKLKHQ